MSWRAGSSREREKTDKKLFNDGWSFCRLEPDADFAQVWGRWEPFRPVDIPHDWLIYDTENLYRDGTGWYHKSFAVDKPERGHVLLRFDGVYMDSTVYLNGRKVTEWKYGYSTFEADLTDYLAEGENDLLVQVVFRSPNSRWYSGAGIYRNVWLKVCPEVYLPFDGTYVTIRETQGDVWEMQISTEVAGEPCGKTVCRYVLTRQGKTVQELGCAEVISGTAELTAYVEKPLLWDVDAPNCYELSVELCGADGMSGNGGLQEANVEAGNAAGRNAESIGGQEKIDGSEEPDGLEEPNGLLDRDVVTVGFRTFEFTTDHGFFLNHRQLKIHGVCEHHDLGCLGSAFYRAAMRRKFLILRQMGVNALRTSHNMPAPEVMELADEMGFLVVDEAFDMWELPKTEYDYARFFKEWAERDVRSWVRRDRNHPCLLLWSIGNEIYDTHAGEHGQEITRRLVGDVREHDPRENARITIGSNYMPWENAQKCADLVKMAGYNYGESCYETHHREHPDWVIYGSETASIVQSRGVYHFPLEVPCLSEVDEQCSSLGNSHTSWGAQDLELLIAQDMACEYSAGQFLWTGFDYIGEPTPYHTKNSYFGQIDTAGFPKDAYYVFQSEWRDAGECPMVHLFPYWDWNEGQLIDVLACSNGESVELFVNGRSQGRQKLTHWKTADRSGTAGQGETADRSGAAGRDETAGSDGGRLLAKWKVAYEPGEILAVAYDGEGREIARETQHSFGDSAAVTLEADRTEILANGEDLCYIFVGMTDAEGYPVENAMDYVMVHVEGPGRLLGLDNGDSTDYDLYKGNCRKLFNGKLAAVIGSTGESGEITVRVEPCDSGIAGAALALRAVPAAVREGICCRENCDGISECGCTRIPVRKAELSLDGQERVLTPEHPRMCVQVKLLPGNTTDRDVVWEAVNDGGIPLGYVKIEALDERSARVEAFGDGAFRIRCQLRDRDGKVRLLSALECEAKGFGQALFNPYEYISAGLYTEAIGEVSNGNEKGIATGRSDRSGVFFDRIDFGEFGSDVVTADIFALNDEPYEIEIWEGNPDAGTGRLIDRVTYRKPTIWNVYQAETWKLPVRLKGVTSLSFVAFNKMHFKGFSFRYLEKAFQRLTGADCTKVYGDSFRRDGESIREIGNNVTVVYDGMDFGEGAERVTIWGRTQLTANTIHLLFTGEDGTQSRVIVEYPGEAGQAEVSGPCGGSSEAGQAGQRGEMGQATTQGHSFPVAGFRGRGKLELVFLPGSHFDLEALQFGPGGSRDGA